jgi:integrase
MRVIATQTALDHTCSTTVPASIEDLDASARMFAAANRSINTKKAYTSDWRDFAAWAERYGYESMPADPAVVALYITDLDARLKPSTISRRLAVISVAHRQAGQPIPTSRDDLRAISTGTRRTLGFAQREVAPLSMGDVTSMVAHLPDTLIGRRDRALLLAGFAGALRRSELVAIDVDDLEPREEGLALILHRSKTDQEGKGRQVALPCAHDHHTCPVRAIAAWREDAGIDDGALFRTVDRHDRVGEHQLRPGAVNLIVKTAASGAGARSATAHCSPVPHRLLYTAGSADLG